MRDINLLQEQASSATGFDAKASLKPALFLLAAVVVVIAGAYAVIAVLTGRNVSRIADAAAEAATYQQAAEVKNAVALKQAQAESIQALLDTASATGTVDTELFDLLTGSLTGDAFLQTLTLDDAYGMELTGIAPTRADVASFVYKLKQTGRFEDVQIQAITEAIQEQEGAAIVCNFSVQALLKGGDSGEQ